MTDTIRHMLAVPPFSDASTRLDLRDADDLRAVEHMAALLVDSGASFDELRAYDQGTAGLAECLTVRVAFKLAISKLRLLELAPQHLSVVFAVYKEHQRMQALDDHENGEDCLRRKFEQLEWLTGGTHHSWDMAVVDDGCPEGSGNIAQDIVATCGRCEQVQVLYLDEAIRAGHPMTTSLKSTTDSQKGGSVLLGMYEAARQQRDGEHSILFTDADLSTHLGQSGSLIAALHHGADVAIGSRREMSSVVLKKGRRNSRGKLFIYLWKCLLEGLGGVTDTQCGFKVFRAEVVSELLSSTKERRFAFDLELLLLAQLRRAGSIAKVPVAWIDSEAASTTTDIGPYLEMLQSVVGLYRRMLPGNRAADAVADLIMSLDEESWVRLIEQMPAAIADGDPQAFPTSVSVTVAELAVAAGLSQ